MADAIVIAAIEAGVPSPVESCCPRRATIRPHGVWRFKSLGDEEAPSGMRSQA